MYERKEVDELIEKAKSSFKTTCKTFSASTIDGYWEALGRDGVIVIDDVYSNETIDAVNEAQMVVFKYINQLIDQGKIEENKLVWLAENDNLNYLSKSTYTYEDLKNINLGNGRYDYLWGLNKGIFDLAEFYFPTPVKEWVTRGLEIGFYKQTGTLPVLPGSKEGDWHRDIVPLFSDNNLNLSLPPCYYTVLIPLMDLSEENGTTQFIIGSHKVDFEKTSQLSKVQFAAKKGSVILLDGRIFHRGMPNLSNEVRQMLYIIYAKNWYLAYNNTPSIL